MRGLKKILLVTVIIADVNAQWQPRGLNGASSNNQPQLGYQYNVPSQQPPVQQFSQQWSNSNYPRQDQWSNFQPGKHQLSQQQWNGNLQSHRNVQKHQREQNLVDYPFTVEYVDRRRPKLGSTPNSRKGVGSVSKPQYDDENLIDYPFTIEYISNTNNPSENQASLPSNQDSFQFKTQQQHYQPNHHHHFAAYHNTGDPSY